MPAKTSATREALGCNSRLELPLAEIGLCNRTVNCLEEKGVLTVNDLLHCTCEDLLSISNFGTKTLAEVFERLAEIGFHRKKSSLNGQNTQAA